MKRIPNITQGKSNIVTYHVQENSKGLLHKFFAPKLVCYDTNWPMSRMLVEAHTLEYLSKLSMDDSLIGIPAPCPEQYTNHSIAMQYIAGTSLSDLLSQLSANDFMANSNKKQKHSLPDYEQLLALITFLKNIAELPISDFTNDMTNALLSQTEIVECMYKNKLKNQVPILTSDPRFFCLGDVSLNNILFDETKLYLIDFECAHLGYYGYDISQLLGMAKAYSEKSQIAEKLYQDLLKAFYTVFQNHEKTDAILALAELFYKYYCSV